jgi:hypothetical protein
MNKSVGYDNELRISIPCKKMSKPTDPTMMAPLDVEIAASSLILPFLSGKPSDVERSRRGARSDEPSITAMPGYQDEQRIQGGDDMRNVDRGRYITQGASKSQVMTMRARILRLKDDKCGKWSAAPARRLPSAGSTRCLYIEDTARYPGRERCVKFDRNSRVKAETTQGDIAARETGDICDVNAHWPTVEATHRGATAPDLDSSGKLASTNNITTTALRQSRSCISHSEMTR